MQGWQEDQIQDLLTIRGESNIFGAVTKVAIQLGFEYCAYGIRTPLPLSNPRIVMYSTYPVNWQARYLEHNYVASDPTVLHGLRSLLPIVWSDKLFESTPQLWEEARSYGLNHGWAQSSRDANGIGGMLTLARSGEELSALELREHGLKMNWLTQIAHIGMSQQLADKLLPEMEASLSDREVEVLRWTAEGKTSAEISYILNISGRTVNFHISNAMIKLNAVNKTSAVIRAARIGIL